LRKVFSQNAVTMTRGLNNVTADLFIEGDKTIYWQAFARVMDGTGHVRHSSGTHFNDDFINNRHSSWFLPRK
jgi:hypothetical protein